VDPVELATQYRADGAAWLHVVDMDRAFATGRDNTATIRAICALPDVHVQVGGNVTDGAYARGMLDGGAARVVFGTVTLAQLGLLRGLLASVPVGSAAVAIDVEDGHPALRGDVSQAATIDDLARQVRECGIQTVVYRDKRRDGALTGAALEDGARLSRTHSLDVVLAGGVADLAELRRARDAGIAGVIVGRALHEQRFTLGEALACLA